MADKLFEERKAKIVEWEKMGFSGYATTFCRSHNSEEITELVEKDPEVLRAAPDLMKGDVAENYAVAGRLMNVRDMGKMAFLKVRDGYGDLQICLTKNVLGDDFKNFLKILDLGDFVGFSGELFKTKHGELSLMAAQVTPLSKALRPLPEKWAGLKDREACYRERNLDLATNTETFTRFKQRSEVVSEIRKFFYEKDFIEIETPVLQPQAGGAMARTFSTHHNALDHEFVLRIALELDHKRTVGGGFERVFEIGKNFRNEGIDPSHLQEFTMCEWYAAYEDLKTNEKWMQEMLHRICENVFGKMKFEILDKDEKPVEVDFSGDFAEVKFSDLLKDFAGIDMFEASIEELQKKAKELGVEDVDSTGRGNLLDEIYKKTARPHLIQPTFVTDWPSDLKPLARPNGNGTSEVYQLLVAGWEIINAYGELIDPQVQRDLLEAQAAAKAAGDEEAMEVDEVFLKAMEHGFPPMTGNGFGVDRIVALLTGQPNLRDVVLFPTMKPEGGSDNSRFKETQLAVAVISDEAKLEPWQEMNTMAHLSAAFGAREGKKLFYQDELTSRDGEKIKLNTEHAIMVKRTETDKSLKDLVKSAKDSDLHVAEFTRSMIETSDDKKLVQDAKSKNYADIEHLGILIFGKKSEVEKMTKGFELF